MDFKDFTRAVAYIYPIFLVLASVTVSLGIYIWKSKFKDLDDKLRGLESSINYESKFRDQTDGKIEMDISKLVAASASNEKDISTLTEKVNGIEKICNINHRE